MYVAVFYNCGIWKNSVNLDDELCLHKLCIDIKGILEIEYDFEKILDLVKFIKNKVKYKINTNNADINKVKVWEYLIYIEFEKIKKIKFHKKHKNKKRMIVKECANFNAFTLFLFQLFPKAKFKYLLYFGYK